MGFNSRKNTSIYANTSDASGGGGKVSGTSSPGGSYGKEINAVNDAPFGANSNVARPFGGFGMGSGSYSKSDAGVGGPVNISSGRRFRPHLYGRRGRTEGSQGGGSGFAKLAGGAPVSGGSSIKSVFSSGAQ